MRIIFLDIDGVINSDLYFASGRADQCGFLRNRIDPLAVQLLNTLIKNTGARVVVTSTWRLENTLPELQIALEKSGFVGEIIDATKCLGDDEEGPIRGVEIQEWIIAHPEDVQYVIFDDVDDMLPHQQKHYIKVDKRVGLTPLNIETAQKILIAA